MSRRWWNQGIATGSLVTNWYRGRTEESGSLHLQSRGDSLRPLVSSTTMVIDPGHTEPHVAQARVIVQSGRVAVFLTRLLHVTFDLP